MVSSSRICIDDELKKAERNYKEHQRVEKIRKALGSLNETTSNLLRRYGMKRKRRTKRDPTQLEILREAIETIEFLNGEVKRLDGIESSTYHSEATSTGTVL